MIIDDDLRKLRDEIENESNELIQQLDNFSDTKLDPERNLMYITHLLKLFNKRSSYVETLVEKIFNEIQQKPEAS
jgi:predicted  nucleic acid-binding Zn-ribbon protein